MKRLLLPAFLAVVAAPLAAHAQQITADDVFNAGKATAEDLSNTIVALNAQLIALKRERADLLKKAAEAEKHEPKPAPSAPAPVNPK